MRATNRLIALAAATLACAAPAQTPPGPHDRAEATAVIRDLRRIVAPTGLQAIETVRIGGIDQAVSIRSQDVRNPVLIYLHGGPGFMEMPIGWWYDTGWADYFTVVHWDQRGAGKTFGLNPPPVPSTLTVDRYQQDAEALVQWARTRFTKRKVFVIGHSWGSLLGLRLAERHPEWLHAYIGIGQVTDFLESERRGWAWTVAQAKAAGNRQALDELQAIAPYATAVAPPSLAAVMVQRKWLNLYGGAAYRRPTGADFEVAAIKLSPDYSDQNVKTAFAGQPAVGAALIPAMVTADLSTIRRLKVPLLLFLGRHDINVSSDVAAEWFAKVQAPAKRLVWFERSGHHVTSEEPGKLLVSLVAYARPIAARAGDVAPDR